jgi:hypothetical protein
MRYTDSQLREIAQGRRLPLETKLFGATVLALVVLNLLFQWNSERLAIVFFGLGMINYFAHRMNAISHFVFDGDRFNENGEKVEVNA